MEAKKGYTAISKNVPMSPFKIRPVADNIRKKPYTYAVSILEAMPNKSAKLLLKTIQSAAANAMYYNKQLDEEMLFISELMVDEGRKMKRMWPRSHGRADRLIKRASHISVVVDEKVKAGK